MFKQFMQSQGFSDILIGIGIGSSVLYTAGVANNIRTDIALTNKRIDYLYYNVMRNNKDINSILAHQQSSIDMSILEKQDINKLKVC